MRDIEVVIHNFYLLSMNTWNNQIYTILDKSDNMKNILSSIDVYAKFSANWHETRRIMNIASAKREERLWNSQTLTLKFNFFYSCKTVNNINATKCQMDAYLLLSLLISTIVFHLEFHELSIYCISLTLYTKNNT